MRPGKKIISIVSAACLLGVTAHALAEDDQQAGAESPYDGFDLQMAAFLSARASRLKNLEMYVERVKSVSIAESALEDGSCISAANCAVFEVYTQGTYPVTRQLSYLEVATKLGISPGADALDALGTGYVGAQLGFNRAATGSSDPSGKLATVFDYMFKDDQTEEEKKALQAKMSWQRPWEDPFSMIGAGGYMMMDTADSVRDAEDALGRGAETAADNARREEDLLSHVEPRGIEEYNGVMAALYETTSPPTPMGEVEGMQVVANKVRLWFDPERNVSIGHRFDGTIIENGESRDFYIQVRNSDFRNPPGCFDLIKPYRRVMEMGGVLNDEQKAQMKEARKQLAEYDKQMAALPASQRQMMENMMGGKMEAARNMVRTGSLSYTMEIEEILCNPDLHALFSTPLTGAGPIQISGDKLLRQIQVDLTKLGYEPGNTDGVLDMMTQVSISQFQAEAGLTVTGEPSQELATALTSAVAAL